MRKYAFVIAVISIALITGISFAQTPRNATPQSDGCTDFTNIGAVGNDITGVPGYLKLVSGTGRTWYIYVDTMGMLRIASDVAVGGTASPIITSWGTIGARVGGQ